MPLGCPGFSARRYSTELSPKSARSCLPIPIALEGNFVMMTCRDPEPAGARVICLPHGSLRFACCALLRSTNAPDACRPVRLYRSLQRLLNRDRAPRRAPETCGRAVGDVFRGSKADRSDKFAGSEFGRACAPEGPATGRRWSTMTRKIIAAARLAARTGQPMAKAILVVGLVREGRRT